MKNCETACFVFFAEEGCTFSRMDDLNTEAMHRVTRIKNYFEELEA